MASTSEYEAFCCCCKLQHGKDRVITIKVIEQMDVTREHYLRLLEGSRDEP